MKENASRIPRKAVSATITLVSLLLVTTISVSAWFASLIRKNRTDEGEIVMPPIIYVKDNNLYEMQSFHLDGLRISEEYNVVFCVSPTIPGSAKSFFLGLIYTENLGMHINIYPVYSVSDTRPGKDVLYEECVIRPEGESVDTTCYFQYYKSSGDAPDVPANQYDYKVTYGNWENPDKPAVGGSLNNGIYKSYDHLKFDALQEEPGALLEKVNDLSRYRFFVLNITWDENAGEGNAKEVDAVYIVTRGER